MSFSFLGRLALYLFLPGERCMKTLAGVRATDVTPILIDRYPCVSMLLSDHEA